MATEIPLFTDTFTAENDLSADQYKFVEITGDNQVDTCDGAADSPIGVLQNKPAAGEAAEVMIAGVTKVEAGGALTAGDIIGTAADGQATALTVGTDTTAYIAGQVHVGVSNAGEVATASINCLSVARAQ